MGRLGKIRTKSRFRDVQSNRKAGACVINSVWEELEDLAKQKRGLLLELLKSRCKLIEDPEGKNHTDRMLVELSRENKWPVLTVDTRLKENLSKSGCQYIEVVSDRMLRLIG